MRTIGVVIAVLWLSAACASNARWTKPGATADSFARDKWTCLEHAKSLNRNDSWTSTWTEASIYNQCMADHGWRKE